MQNVGFLMTRLILISVRVSEWPSFGEESVPSYCVLFSFDRAGQWTQKKSNRKAMNRNWDNQKANPALKTKAEHK